MLLVQLGLWLSLTRRTITYRAHLYLATGYILNFTQKQVSWKERITIRFKARWWFSFHANARFWASVKIHKELIFNLLRYHITRELNFARIHVLFFFAIFRIGHVIYGVVSGFFFLCQLSFCVIIAAAAFSWATRPFTLSFGSTVLKPNLRWRWQEKRIQLVKRNKVNEKLIKKLWSYVSGKVKH